MTVLSDHRVRTVTPRAGGSLICGFLLGFVTGLVPAGALSYVLLPELIPGGRAYVQLETTARMAIALALFHGLAFMVFAATRAVRD